MTAKVIFPAVLSIIAGAAFIAVGIYFLSSRFLQKLNEASAPLPENNSEAADIKNSAQATELQASREALICKNAFRAKGSGYTTLALGALTLVQAFLLFTFPIAASWLSLIYLFFVMAAVLVLVFVFK